MADHTVNCNDFCHMSKKQKFAPFTETGANTIGCLLNGAVLKPKGGGITPTYDCYYQHITPGDSGYIFHVSVRDYSNTEHIRTVAINIGGVKLADGVTILLNNGNDYKSGRARCSNGLPFDNYVYLTTDTFLGSIHLSKFDEINQIASGTFDFKGRNSFGDSVNITDGRFDMKFSK